MDEKLGMNTNDFKRLFLKKTKTKQVGKEKIYCAV